MRVRVTRPGLLTTVQDLGRHGHQHEGVPVGGAMDAYATRLANLLVGNDENGAVIEMTLAGPRLEFDEAVSVALTGGTFDVRINGNPVPPWRAFSVHAGAVLDAGAAMSGCRGYIALAGGVDVPRVLGSRSTYIPAAMGGPAGRALRAGDVIASGGTTDPRRQIHGRTLAPSLRPVYGSTVRVIVAAELSTEARQALLEREFRISERSDRMGYRLEAEGLAWPAAPAVLSSAVTMGTLQLPPDGSPILLMADRQTTGGYPVLGQVATVDLGSAAQLRPGERMRFAEVSLDEAQRLYLGRERALGALRHGLLHSP